MHQSEQINELAGALAKAQGAMSNADKNRVNPHFKSKYADLAAVLDAIRAPMSANGLSYTQTMGFSANGQFIVRTTLMHSSGQYISTEYPVPATGRPHEMGSAQTYARRYSLAAIVGVAQDDDDANDAMKASPQQKMAPRENPHVTKPDDVWDDLTVELPWLEVTPMLVKDTKPEYVQLVKDMIRYQSVDELKDWRAAVHSQVSAYAKHWKDFFTGAYNQYKKELETGTSIHHRQEAAE